jgi:C-terminal processing protease CtpA/Prc
MNNQKLKEYRGDDFYKEINHNLGSFFLLFAKKYFINNLPDTVHKFPENVAILVNKSCASSTEQFLLAAKQSSKVKIFGTLTSGFLDFSNLNMVDSPCGNFKLYYAMSKGVDLEDYPIDNTGIQPDYYLDDEIPEYQWMDYVSNILNNDF